MNRGRRYDAHFVHPLYRQRKLFGVLCNMTLTGVYRGVNRTHCLGYQETPWVLLMKVPAVVLMFGLLPLG